MLALELRSWGDWIVAVLAWWAYGSVMFLVGAAWVAGATHRRELHRLERAADRARDPRAWAAALLERFGAPVTAESIATVAQWAADERGPGKEVSDANPDDDLGV